MLIAMIPGLVGAVVHDPIISFGIGNQPRVLHCIQKTGAVVLRIFETLLQKILEHRHHFIFAHAITPADRKPAVQGWITFPWSEAAVAEASNPGCLGSTLSR